MHSVLRGQWFPPSTVRALLSGTSTTKPREARNSRSSGPFPASLSTNRSRSKAMKQQCPRSDPCRLNKPSSCKGYSSVGVTEEKEGEQGAAKQMEWTDKRQTERERERETETQTLTHAQRQRERERNKTITTERQTDKEANRAKILLRLPLPKVYGSADVRLHMLLRTRSDPPKCNAVPVIPINIGGNNCSM